jgi:EAL domain-containing protein (putative c-di-GMP-specific phosphodiesterase class I)
VNEIKSTKCLVRWRHAQYGGYIYPDNFIPVIEQNGLINDLTRSVLKKSVQQLDL